MTAPSIRITGLRKAFGDRQVLDGVDLEVAAGSSLVVIGGSGTGKSVLLKCILGLIEPDAGRIEFDGQDILALPVRERAAQRQRIGMLFQNGALFDSLPVWENVAFGLLARGSVSRQQGQDIAAHYLAKVGLGTDIGLLSPAELSGGMQKRVGLARAIAMQPDILFFDEPTTGLDPIMGAVIDGLIMECVRAGGDDQADPAPAGALPYRERESGSTAIAITHDMASARRIGDNAAMLHQGKIVWSGHAADLMTSGNPFVEQFTHGRREGPIQMQLRR